MKTNTAHQFAPIAFEVIPLSNSAGPETKTAPTSTIKPMEKILMNSFTSRPNSLPTNSGCPAPLLLTDIIPER
ncbi:hypothetical protein SDC9_99131 [bioreactor metagenome]|uniref:Uncharacterized protein n=1 Tax=bioreactor metagenome TaxID=1076179 RepID=A0A645AGN8_9ZZZZ